TLTPTAPYTPQTTTLTLHDPLPISGARDQLSVADGDLQEGRHAGRPGRVVRAQSVCVRPGRQRQEHPGAEHLQRSAGRLLDPVRSEEHTSELQSRENLVCRLLLEKK